MNYRKFVYRETALVAGGQAICVAGMLAVFALLGKFDRAVLLGGLFGGLLAVLNFFFMAVGVALAADKAEAQDISGGRAMIRMSYLLRMVLLFVIALALVKSGLCNVIAVLLPLTFTRPILSLGEFFRKAGECRA